MSGINSKETLQQICCFCCCRPDAAVVALRDETQLCHSRHTAATIILDNRTAPDKRAPGQSWAGMSERHSLQRRRLTATTSSVVAGAGQMKKVRMTACQQPGGNNPCSDVQNRYDTQNNPPYLHSHCHDSDSLWLRISKDLSRKLLMS